MSDPIVIQDDEILPIAWDLDPREDVDLNATTCLELEA